MSNKPTLANVVERMRNHINNHTGRSAWDKGVAEYALELIEILEMNIRDGCVPVSVFTNFAELEKAMLNGAKDWKQYSEGWCALCCDMEIANRLCTPLELRKTDYGQKDPNPRENWIGVQARALYQAAYVVKMATPSMINFDEMEVD